MYLRNLALPYFLEYIKDKRVLCFGAGKIFEKLCEWENIEPYVKVVLDNNADKYEKKIIRAGQNFDVDFGGNIELYLEDDTVLLITAEMGGAGKEIYDSLKKEKILTDVECFFADFMLNEKETQKYLYEKFGNKIDFEINNEQLIPKYIHYCWFGDNRIPKEQQKFIRGWHEICPGFEIICWNESNYDYKKNKYMKKAYELGKWGFVPDFARKDIIYEHGGIYLDTDVEIIKPLDELLCQKGFAGIQADYRVAFGLGFGAVPKLAIMEELCDVYNGIEFSFFDGRKIKVGPDYETEILETYGYRRENKLQKIAELTIYPMDVLSGTLPYSIESFITENTFTVHHYAGSWITEKSRKENEDIRTFYREIMIEEKMMKRIHI